MADESEGFEEARTPKKIAAAERAQLAIRLGGIVGRLQALAQKRIGERQPLEDRWLEDLMQYHGRYDHDTQKKLLEGKKSQLFINETRPKTDAMSARLMDLLFPTDDKNWGIQPTPVPKLTAAAEKAEQAAAALAKAVQDRQDQLPEGQQPDPQLKAQQELANAAALKAEALQKIIEEGRRRCDLMSAEIDDQLKESNYHAVKRDQIEDACKLGTGVTKGPVTGDKVRKGWKQSQQATNADGSAQMDQVGQPVMTGPYSLKMSNGDTPSMRHVDLWSFFPDMDVSKIEDGEGNLERHLMNAKKLKCLARLPGFDKEAIKRLLRSKPRQAAPSYMAQLRNITGDKTHVANDLYHVWEYSGPLSIEDMHDLALAVGDQATIRDLADVDPLVELNAVVWFCDGELLKFSIYPYDSGECMYSVYCLVKDESSIFGYGIPSIMRDPQKSLNAAWRAMMDNAGLAAGPQVVISKTLIEPENGVWTMEARKVWLAKDGIPKEHRAFETFDVPMHQAEMANIITLSKQFIDDMTAMPQIAQGDQGATTKTFQGMALLMNSANVVFRRFVKNYDDDVTTPDLRRFYDWNMQFNPKEEIKGDYEVDARGSSVLLVREMQAQTLMAVATQLGGHPVYGPMLRNREVLRKLFQALMIPSADVVLTDNEIDALMAAAAANDQVAQEAKAKRELEENKLEVERERIEAQVQMANQENQSRKDIAYINRETELIKLATTANVSLDKLEAQLQINRDNIASKERTFAAEVAVEQRNADEARARGEEPDGSGGYVAGGGAAKPRGKKPNGAGAQA